MIKAVEWLGDKVKIIDQTKLPGMRVFIDITNHNDMVTAIKELKVRGAPAIGVATAYGIALGAQRINAFSTTDFLNRLDLIINDFATARPTAVNLFKSITRMKQVIDKNDPVINIKKVLVAEAIKIHNEEIAATEKISNNGVELIKDGFTILTHCNAGPLATAGYGTALGIIMAAFKAGRKISVIADETRPLLQGARLTVWELMQERIPVTLIPDSAAGYFLSKGKVDCVITGADRIAANGDTANKIGTYSVAVLATYNNVPFYIAAPISTIDPTIKTGEDIVIEERSGDEVTTLGTVRTAPGGARAANPAFDVTPNKLISAIVTEKGILYKPYGTEIKKLF
jgi:methylthioribose-1-phosphate isomerase